MKDKEIFKKLENLSKIEPRIDWVKSNRAILLSQIKAQGQELVEAPKTGLPLYNILSKGKIFIRLIIPKDFVWARRLVTVAIHPIGTIILIIALIMGSGIATVNASFNSLPGDTLYPLKLTTEKIKLTLSLDDKDKVALELEFAGRRIEEFKKLTTKQNNYKEEKIRIPLKEFVQELGNVNARLENIEKNEERVEVVQLATLVDNRTEDYANVLETKKREIPLSIKETMEKAIVTSEETNSKAMSIIISKHDRVEEVVKNVEAKINKASEKVRKLEEKIEEANLEGVAQKPEEVKRVIGEARGLLASGDLTSALEKVREINQLTRNTEELIDKEKGPDSTETSPILDSTNLNLDVTGVSEGINNINNSIGITNNNVEQPARVKGDAISNENISVSGSLLYEEKK